MGATDTYATGIFERAKSKVLYEAGRFLQNRERILEMRDVAALAERKGTATGKLELAAIARRLRAQIDRLYSSQLDLEGKVQSAVAGLQAAGSNPLTLVQSALSVAPLLKDLAAHVGRVKLARKAIDELKARTLTAADLATLSAGPALAGAGTMLLVGGGLFAAYMIFGRRRR